MATAITVLQPLGSATPEDATVKFSTVTLAAADVAGNTIVMPTSKILLLFQNSGASARTVTITSSADPYGRLGTITGFSIAAGAFVARVFEPRGWEQTLGGRDLLVTANNAEIKIAAIAL